MGDASRSFLDRYVEKRDAKAFRELVDRHQDMVYAACQRILKNAADAEDAAQACFLKLVRGPERVTGSVAGWLHRCATNSAIDLARQEGARKAREARAMEVKPADSPSSWQHVAEAVDEAINELPDELRIPVVRYYLERAGQQQIAGELNVTHSAVSKRLKRGIEDVRVRLRKGGIALSAVVLAGLLLENAAVAAPATLASALGKMAIASSVKAAGGTAASMGAKAVAGGMIAKTCVGLGVAAVLVTGGVVAHRFCGEAEAPAAPVAAPPNMGPSSMDAPPMAAIHENLGPSAAGNAGRQATRPAPKTPEELAKFLVAALSEGDVAGARQLYPTREEFLKTFAAPAAETMYAGYFPMLEQGLRVCAERIRGAEYVRWNPQYASTPVELEKGHGFGSLTLAVPAQTMDNTHAVIRLAGKEHDLKLDEMIRIDGAWRALDIPADMASILAARMSEGVAGAGAIRVALRVYAAVHRGEYPVLADGDDWMETLGLKPNDLRGRYFGPEDYTVLSTRQGCTITARLGNETYTIDQSGNESGTFSTGQ